MNKTIVLGKKMVSRTEAVQNYVDKINHTDAVIGISARFALFAWVIKLLGIRKHFIYYCIDFYIPEIASSWLDSIFVWLHIKVDKFLVYHADENWVISERIIRKRWEFEIYICSQLCPYKIVPLGYPPSYFRNVVNNEKNRLIYIGLNKYGFDLIGKVVNDMRDKIKFRSFINCRMPIKNLLDIVSYAGIGIALWEREGNQTYGDSGKIKLYLVCGLPVIVTKNANFSETIEREQAGIAIDYNRRELKEAVNKILDNYDFYRENAIRVGHAYCNSEKIFSEAGLLK